MKKRLKRLVLNRETLRHLQTDQLGRIVGAGDCTAERVTTCWCTEANCDSGGGGTSGASCNGTCVGCCQGETDERYSGCASNCG